ncbi:hypothetical protein [Vreelandella sp. V005]|uniref:hypothetical protein n=1 Tax=Vreelandella sp. V005 TaxID=3459608 RepID=UPI004044223C
MRKIAVFTGTRAEYGLLYWLMKEIDAHTQLELQVIVAAMHLSPELGNIWQLIEQDGFNVGAKVEMLLSSNTRVGVAKSIGLGAIGVVAHTLLGFSKIGIYPKRALLLQPTSLVRKACNIQGAINFLKRKKTNNVISECEIDHPTARCRIISEDSV